MEKDITIYSAKAMESLLTTESEYVNGRYNSCASRCYYSCFQAAIVALLREGIRPRGQWSHEFVQAQFVGVLINHASATIPICGASWLITRSCVTRLTTEPSSSPRPRLAAHCVEAACLSRLSSREEVLPNET